MNISFLLGAGFSQAAGLHQRKDINKVFFDEKRLNKIEQTYAMGKDGILYKGIPESKIIENEYWHILIQILRDYMQFDYEMFYDYLKYKINANKKNIIKHDFLNDKKIKQAFFYLPDIFTQLVSQLIISQKTYFACKTDKYKNFRKWIIDLQNIGHTIFINTLNHDLLIESVFGEQNINDGFVYENSPYSVDINNEKIVSVPFYNKKVFLDKISNRHINFIKLHGSFDYYKDSNEHKLLKCPRGAAINRIEKRNSQPVIENYAPLFLIGNTEKEKEYKTFVYKDRHDIYKDILSESKALFVIGYGFGDDGINNDINEHFNGNLLYVIDPTANEKSCAIKNKCSFLRDRVKFLNKSIEDLTYNDFMQINQDFL